MRTARTDSHAPFRLDRVLEQTFVSEIDYHRAIPSTNTRALERAAVQGIRLPLLVLSESQTAGRGRGANTWWSAPGALTFSLLLELSEVPARPESWPRIALASAVATCEALEAFAPGHPFGIRWPNDVCFERSKICGVLPELHLGATPRLVLGIGINVNNSTRRAPKPLRTTATSLVDMTGRRCDLTDVLVRVLQRLESRLGDLASSSHSLAEEWTRRCLLRGLAVRLRVNDETIEGHCMGIDSTGAIGIRREHRTEKYYGGIVLGATDPMP